MTDLCRAGKIIPLLYLLSLIISTVSSKYIEHFMEEPKICHPFPTPVIPKSVIKIKYEDDDAVVVRPGHTIHPWRDSDKICKYTIRTQPRTGLFAVIQKMSLRKNGSECLDFVEFKEDGNKGGRICGTFEYRNGRLQASSDGEESGIPNFIKFPQPPSLEVKSNKGEIETKIFISKERVKPGETLDLTIVYTPFIECEDVRDLDKDMPHDDTCIGKEFYCDPYKNCALDSCYDQADCKIISDGTGTKVTVGAVTTLFVSFLLFVMCLWTCRKHKKLCWSPDCAGPNVAGGAGNQPIDMGSRSVVPTAPMLDEVSTRPVHDKDLPPSYNSLFPDQANTPAT